MRNDSVDPGEVTGCEDQGVFPFREKPDGALDPAGEAGWYLQRERESRHESLEQVGDATGIHPYHLEAIESGDMTRMPERMDALEMIGIYAHYLGFDPEPLIAHYARFLPAPELAPKTSHPANPAPLSSAKILKFGKLPHLPRFSFRLNGIPGGAGGLVASLAAGVILFGGISYMLMPGKEALQGQSGQMAEVLTPGIDSMPTASTGNQNAEITIGQEELPDDQPPETAEAPLDDDLAGTGLEGLSSLIQNEVQGVGDTAGNLDGLVSATDMAVTGEGREFGTGNAESRLTLKARAPVWVRIEDSKGNVVMTQMLMKGDTYRVPNREGLVVIARDGGLLSYLIDGKERGILGTPGEILVGRSLDLGSFGVKG